MRHFIFILVAYTCLFSAVSADEWNIYPPSNNVSAIALEGDYLWWTSYASIVRYNRLDGSQRVYTLRDYGEGFWFTAAAVAPDGSKWFGTNNSTVVRYDNSGWSTTKVNYPVRVIGFDRDGLAWFGTFHGVACFDGVKWKLYGAAEGFTDREVNAFALDHNGNLWFGTERDGLFRFDGNTWTQYLPGKVNLPDDTIYSLACDSEGTLWAGTSKGLARFNGTVWETLPPLGDLPLENSVRALAADPDGGVWAGTNISLVYLNGTEKTVYTSENSTLEGGSQKQILAALVDEKGVLWAANGRPGDGLLAPIIGLSRFDGKTWTRVKIPKPIGYYTTAVAVDADNVKWFATGIELSPNPPVSFDGSSWKSYTEDDGLFSSRVHHIAIDNVGRKWFCTSGGISCFDGKTWKNYTMENGLPVSGATRAVFDRNGVGWFALGSTLFSFDGHTGAAWSDTLCSYGDVNIISLAVDHNDVKWIGTSYHGVFSFDGKTWRHYTKDDGLSGNCVRTIAVDHDNVVWFGTGILNPNPGITSFDGKSWKIHSGGDFWGVTYDIKVDDANVKWIIAAGVFSYDGTTWKTWTPPWKGGPDGYYCIAIDHDGTKWLGSKHMGIVSFRETDSGTVTGVESEQEQPRACVLHTAHPNPFNPSTILSFTLGKPDRVKLEVYSITGQKVATLVDSRLSAGMHQYAFDGSRLSSGVYFYRLKITRGVEYGKCMLIK